MPATLIIQRPTFTDVDSLTSTVFNGVTILSASVPDAGPASEGVVRLAGDLGGSASSPQLVVTGVTAGTYSATGLKTATFTVDAKGRLTGASERDLLLPDAAPAVTGGTPTPAVKGILALAGDLTGTAALPILVNTTVTAGAYAAADQALEAAADPAALAALVVAAGDVGKRLVRVTSTGFYYLATTAGTGADKWTLQTQIAAGVFTIATFTVDAKGRLTFAGQRSLIIPEATATAPGRIQLAGDLTGPATAPVLIASGVPAGQHGAVESVATPAALAALTVAAGDIDRRFARVLSTGLYYVATTAGTGADKWTVRASVAFEDQIGYLQTVDAKGRVTGLQGRPVSKPAGSADAFVAFDGASTASFRASLAYNRASNVVTVTASAHGFRVGDRVGVDFTSGTAVTDGLYAVASVPDANTFTFAHSGVNTGGNLTLGIFATRNTFNVHSVVKDRRTATGSYWVNFQNALTNDAYLVNGTADMTNGATVVMLNTTAGVRAQDTLGCSIHCYEPGAGATNPPNVSVVIHGG
jgi:hypothetical protein